MAERSPYGATYKMPQCASAVLYCLRSRALTGLFGCLLQETLLRGDAWVSATPTSDRAGRSLGSHTHAADSTGSGCGTHKSSARRGPTH